MAVFSLTTAVANTALNTITTAASTTGTIVIYSGVAPANADASLSGNTVLVTLPCSATLAPGASAHVLTLNAITQTNAASTGTATFYRFLTGGSTVLCQGDVGTSGNAMVLNSTSITSGGPVNISSLTITI